MSSLQALIFDVDGTLADTERDGHRVAFNAAFQDVGLDWDWTVDLYGKLLEVTGGKERIKFYLERFNTAFKAPDDFDGFVADLHRRKTDHYTRLLAEGGIPMRPGVLRLMHEARAAGLRLAIATTTTPANVTALLKYGIGDEAESWFEVIAAGDIVPAKKPASDIYDYALAEMGLQPVQAVAFEDSENGVKSAKGSGIGAIVVTVNDYTHDHDMQGATVVLDQLGEPDSPCNLLQGSPEPDDVVDVPYLRRLHARVNG